MSKIANTIAGAATLLMAALPALALSTAARAAPAHHAVQISDLNLASPAGQRVLSARTEMVANQVCKASGTAFQSLSDAQSCKAGVRAEVAEKAAAVRQTQMAAR